MRPLAAFVVLCAVLSVSADARPVHPEPECWCKCENVRVHDADTVVADVVLPFGNLVIRNKAIRAHGFDAWEVTRHRRVLKLTPEQWTEELRLGEKSKREFIELLNNGTLWIAPIPQKEDQDPYDRIDARWMVRKQGVSYRVEEWAKSHGWCRK